MAKRKKSDDVVVEPKEISYVSIPMDLFDKMIDRLNAYPPQYIYGRRQAALLRDELVSLKEVQEKEWNTSGEFNNTTT